MHLDDDHKKWGVAIFALYFVQCSLGAVIHWVKPSSWTVKKKRPVQNYFHAVLGILVIALAFYQVCVHLTTRVLHPDTVGLGAFWLQGGVGQGNQ